MKDRIPTYPNRVTLTAVTGQTDTYDMVRADEPTEVGTPLNKATLFSDSALSALTGAGLTITNETPSGAFEQIASVIGDNAVVPKMEFKSYAGTGTYNSSNPCSLTFSFKPDLFVMVGSYGTSWVDFLGSSTAMILTIPSALLSASYQSGIGFRSGSSGAYHAKYDDSTNTLTWYTASSAATQFNESDKTYYVLGIKF